MNHELRNGNFTSSEIFALCCEGKIKGSFGKPALTYIEECNMERRLGRSLSGESNARALSWGKLVEQRVYSLLGLEYTICNDKTLVHPTISCWRGTPDAVKKREETVSDIKCPITLKSFVQLASCKTPTELRDNHKDGEKFYWQLVSNSILTKSKYGELISYCPYKSELDAIRLSVDGNQKYYWVWGSDDEELPYLPDGGYFKNINKLVFEIPVKDKLYLHSRVEEAAKELIEIKLQTA
jgi:hypothetical protein